MLVTMTQATLEEFYPAAAIQTLMRIIKDPSLSQQHTMVVQAITFIFKSLGIKCVPYLNQVMPAYLHVIRNSDVTFTEVSLTAGRKNPLGPSRCCDVESTSMTLIQRLNNVVCPVVLSFVIFFF